MRYWLKLSSSLFAVSVLVYDKDLRVVRKYLINTQSRDWRNHTTEAYSDFR
jgi:hypothetical protein